MPGDVVFSVDAEEGKAIRAFRKVLHAQRATGRAAEDSGRRSKRAADQSTAAVEKLSGGVKRSALAWASGLATMSSAVRGVTAAIDVLNRKLAKGVEDIRELHSMRMKHAQIADKDTPLAAHDAEVDQIRMSTGMSGQDAGEYHFAIRSAGMTEYMDDFAQLEGIASPQGMAEAGYSVSKHFPKTSPLAAAGMLLRASKGSPVGAMNLAPNVAKYATYASNVGGGVAETVAAVAALKPMAESEEEAATRLKAFGSAVGKNQLLRKMMRGGVGGGGWVATAERIQERALKYGIPEHELMRGMPKQAWAGYQDLLGSAGTDLRAFTDVTGAPGAEQVMGHMVTRALSDPRRYAERERLKSIQREKVTEANSLDAHAEQWSDTTARNRRTWASEHGNKLQYLLESLGIWATQVALPKSWEPAALGAPDDWQERATRGAAALERAGNVLTKGDVTTRKTSLGRE